MERLRKRENVEFVLNAVPDEFIGDSALEGVRVKFKDGEERVLTVSGAFVAIGQTPSNTIFKDLIDLDEGGYAASTEDCRTRADGVFVAGDCRSKSVRQLTTATADGTVAALAACEYVDNL